jgi:uncharacterized membrane protein
VWSFDFSNSVSTQKGKPLSETKQSGFSDNFLGAVAYITFLPAVAFLILVPYKKSYYVRFHAWQSVFLNFVALVLTLAVGYILPYCGVKFDVLAPIPIKWTIGIFWVLVWVICALIALYGKRFKLPFIGNMAEKQANG